MRTVFALAFTLLSLLMTAISVMAVPFTSASDPTSVNAGQNNQLINFTVNNTGSINITQVNITLPPGFTFTGTSGTTTATSYTASATTPSWINTSSLGLVGNGTSQYFWIYVNTPSTTGSYSFNISTLDANGGFNSTNVTFSIFDTLAPTYSSNTTSPASNSSYSAGRTYWFNITWTDGTGVSRVLIEHNITGSSTIHNETMSNTSSVYYFNVTDLAVGTYMWRVYANDTNNTFNSTPQFTYIVRQTSNELTVYLNNILNSNTTSIVNTDVNVTASASCTQPNCNITLSRDGTTIASVKPNPYSTNDTLTSNGLHNYTISVSSNGNFSSNSTTYFVGVVPSYTTGTTNIPLTFSNTTVSYINITFNSNPNLENLYVQGDWTGTSTNYNMSNISGTNYFYNTTFPAGTFSWKIFGVYSGHAFNLTTSNNFTINKAAPNLALSITPQWTLDLPIQTNVSCTVSVSSLTAKLYRNGTAVSNPEVQTFTAGTVYEYLCNNTVNQNYTTDTVKNNLIIKSKPSASLSFVQPPILIEVVQNSTSTSEIKVKNTGNVLQDATLEIEGIDKSWYSVDQPSIAITGGATRSFTVTFKVDNIDVKDYLGKFTVKGTNATISQDFTLRVLPSAETKVKINDTLALYKLDSNKLESKLEELKTKTNNTAAAEQKLNELKSALKQAEDYIASNNYFQAQQTLETVKALISEFESQLKAAEIPATKVQLPSSVWLVIGGVIILIVIIVLAYLFWPLKRGYKPETGYVYGGGEEKKGLLTFFKNFLSRFKRKKKTETVLEG